MRRKIFALLIAGVIALSYSCSNSGKEYSMGNQIPIDQILQEQDGTISLDVDQADTYSDASNPSDNTAEWNVKVSKSGRFNVWLSSMTNDSTNLNYKDSVRVSVMDNKSLEALPSVSKIIGNSTDVSMPYRADSFIGSLYIRDTGLVSIQVVSEKILPKKESSDIHDSKLVSVILTPERMEKGL